MTDVRLSLLCSTLGFEHTNVDVGGYPEYASCVAFELWRHLDASEQWSVRVHYLRASGKLELTPRIVGCTSNCTLDAFVQRSASYEIGDTNKVSRKSSVLFDSHATFSSANQS